APGRSRDSQDSSFRQESAGGPGGVRVEGTAPRARRAWPAGGRLARGTLGEAGESWTATRSAGIPPGPKGTTRMAMPQQESDLTELTGVAELPTPFGLFKIRGVLGGDGREHVLVFKGEVEGQADLPVRIHSECLT